MAAAGMPNVGALEIMVVHLLNHPDRKKKLSDICFLLNVEEPHTVNYALKKLMNHKLIQANRQGKEIFYCISKKGEALCCRYAEVRGACLIDSLPAFADGDDSLKEVARVLRTLSGLYDQAARAAASL